MPSSNTGRRWLAALFACAVLIGPLANAESEPNLITTAELPDIATFMKIGSATPAGVSWDGDNVFIRTSMSGAPQIHHLRNGWPYQLTTFEDGVDFFSLSWGGNLAIVGASIGGSEQSQLFLMETATGKLVQLTDDPSVRHLAVAWDLDDESFFYSSNKENGRDFFVYRMDIVTGEVFKEFEGNGSWQGVADISADGSRLLISQWTSNTNNNLYLVDLLTGDWRQINSDTADVVYGSPHLLPDRRTILLTCNDNPEGIPQFARLSIETGELTWVGDGWVEPTQTVESFVLSRDNQWLAAQINVDGWLELRIRELESGATAAAPDLQGLQNNFWFDTKGRIVFGHSDPTRAPDVWRWDPSSESLEQLTFATYNGIDRSVFSMPQLVSFESFDGLEIPAFLYLPPNYQEGTPIPFVVHAHGGPESQFQPGFIRNFQYLILNGFGVLAVNPRGSDGYGRTFLALDNYKLRKNSLKDYKASVDWLIANSYTSPGQIAVRGGSYGGYVTMGMITEYPDLFAAAINIVGIVNFQTFLENTADYRRHIREAEYGPLSDSAFLHSISPIHKADVIRTPLLVIHGENDPRVPVGEARQIIAAVNANGGVVDSLIFPDEGHGTTKTVNVVTEYRKQVQFLREHLMGMTVKDEDN